VLAFSDHNTGGFSLGNMASSGSYAQMTPDALLRPLRNMTASTPVMWKHLGDERTPEKVKAVVKADWGIEITDEDASRILALAERYKNAAHNAFGEVICARYTHLGWTSHGHVGGDVPLFAYGPGKPAGLLDGPDIGRVTADALGLDLDKLNQRLFAEAEAALQGALVAIDKSDPANPVIRIELQDKVAELPVNKNLLKIGDQAIELEGVVVCAPDTQKAYVPLQAVNILKGASAPLPSVVKEGT
jgi:alkaline phosphatase